MDSAAQIILAIGASLLLAMMGSAAVIWSLRCDPKRAHYRLPTLLAVTLPAASIILTKVG